MSHKTRDHLHLVPFQRSRTPKSGKMSAVVCSIAIITIGIDLSIGNQAVNAESQELHCTGSDTVTFSPPLTDTVQPTTVTYNGSFNCTSQTDTTINSASYKIINQGNFSCPSSQFFLNDITYNFNNGKSSTVHFSSGQLATNTIDPINNYLTSFGTVNNGDFTGDKAVQYIVYSKTEQFGSGFCTQNHPTSTAYRNEEVDFSSP